MNTVIKLMILLILFGTAVNAAPVSAKNSSAEFLVSFDSFREGLEKAIRNSGAEPETGVFHFVILMNTVRTSGPKARAVRDLYNGLLRQYLVEDKISSDTLSFSPFELDLWGRSVWNQRFRRTDISDLYALAPKFPQRRNDSQGGHDDERALLSALNRIEHPESSVIVLLSDSEVSEPPITPTEYISAVKASDYAAQLDHLHFALSTRGRIEGKDADATGKPVRFAVFYTIYTPTNLQPLAELPKTTRSSLLSKVEVPLPARIEKHPDQNADEKLLHINWVLIALMVIILGMVGILIWYLIFLNKPRFVQIESTSGAVQYGRPLYIGGDMGDPKCISLNGLSDHQKIAILEVLPSGKVIIRNYAGYQVTSGQHKNQVILSALDKTISIKNTQAGTYSQFKARIITN